MGWGHLAGVMKSMGPELLSELLDRHTAALVLYARQWSTTAEDVVQDVFVKLLAQRPAPSNPVAWLYRVVRNDAVSSARSERRRERHERAAGRLTPTWFCPSEERLDVETVTAALQDLPIEQREVIVVHLWGGQTFQQVADLIGTTASSAHRWYLAGLTTLRERLRLPCPKKSLPS